MQLEHFRRDIYYYNGQKNRLFTEEKTSQHLTRPRFTEDPVLVVLLLFI